MASKKHEDRFKILLQTPGVDQSEVTREYDDWAEDYDKDVASNIDQINRVHLICDEIDELFNGNKNIRILDVGAGTGDMGKMLGKAGYTDIDALDPSSKMLDVARRKNLYKTYICEYLGPKKLDIPDETYDLIISNAALIHSHINESSFEEMIRITKKGGYMMHIVPERAAGSGRIAMEETMQKFHDEGKWEWVAHIKIDDFERTTFEGKTRHGKGFQYIFKVPCKK